MRTQIHNRHASTVSTEPKRILTNSGTATADSTPITEADFAAHFARARRTDDLWSEEFEILPEQAVDNNVEDKLHNDGIEKEQKMLENESSNKSDYNGPTLDDGHRLIREALVEREEKRLGHLLDDSCKKVAIARLQEAHEHTKRKV